MSSLKVRWKNWTYCFHKYPEYRTYRYCLAPLSQHILYDGFKDPGWFSRFIKASFLFDSVYIATVSPFATAPRTSRVELIWGLEVFTFDIETFAFACFAGENPMVRYIGLAAWNATARAVHDVHVESLKRRLRCWRISKPVWIDEQLHLCAVMK